MNLILCPKCNNVYLVDGVCPLCKFSIEEAVGLIGGLDEEKKQLEKEVLESENHVVFLDLEVSALYQIISALKLEKEILEKKLAEMNEKERGRKILNLISCPRCRNTYLDDGVCPMCKFSIVEAVELISVLEKERKGLKSQISGLEMDLKERRSRND